MVQIFGQMARVPVTARQKFHEAAYFYNGMIAQRLNVRTFPYYLSGFLSALRSVTYYMQKQYTHEPGFDSWYQSKQAEMKADPTLKLLHSNRNDIVHKEPVDLFFYRSFEFPARFGNRIETKHLEFRYDQTPEGDAKTIIKVHADGVEEEVKSRITWHFTEEDKVDVAQHCHIGLERLDSILNELEKLYPPSEQEAPLSPEAVRMRIQS